MPASLSWAQATDNETAGVGPRVSAQAERERSRLYERGLLDEGSHRSRTLTPGKTYRFQVQARDAAGNVSTPAAGPAFHVTALQENARLTYSSGWLAASRSRARAAGS